MNNIFICNSPYQILISAIMCELYYTKDENTLLLDEYLYNNISGKLNFSSKHFFKNVLFISSRSPTYDISIIFAKSNFERIHLFNWGNACTRYIYDNYNNSEFIALDEGLGSYRLFDIWDSQGINLLKLKNVYLLDPSLSIDFEHGLNIKEIELKSILSSKSRWEIFLGNVNALFGYIPDDLPTVLYFDRYFVSENTLPYVYEQFFLEQLLKVLSPYDFGIKIHPSENVELAKLRYGIYAHNILKNSVVPWELILMNRTNKPLVLISINSTPIILSKFWGDLLDISINSILMIDLVQDYIDQQELYILPLIEHYNAIHPETSVLRARNFYDVASQIAFSFPSEKRKVLLSHEFVKEQSELTWLKSQIKQYSKLFGNLIAIVQISLQNNHCQIESITRPITYVEGIIELNIVLDKAIDNCDEIEIIINTPNLVLSIRRYEIKTCSFSHKVNKKETTNRLCIESKGPFSAFTNLNIYIELEKPLIGFDYTQL